MITIKDIIRDSKPHPLIDGGRQTTYETPTLKISIVGGDRSLYGDFKETFEVAIIEKDSGKFMSGYFYPELSDSYGDTMPHLSKEHTLEVVNTLLRRKGSNSL